jgi:uncharacterized protein (DUF2062 family)
VPFFVSKRDGGKNMKWTAIVFNGREALVYGAILMALIYVALPAAVITLVIRWFARRRKRRLARS